MLRLPGMRGDDDGSAAADARPSLAPPEERTIPDPVNDIDVDDIDWDSARLDALNGEVDEMGHKLLTLDWRVSELDNKLSLLSGETGFATQTSIKRTRYTMGVNSSSASSPVRDGSQLSPPPGVENFTVHTPTSAGPSMGPPAPMPDALEWNEHTGEIGPGVQ